MISVLIPVLSLVGAAVTVLCTHMHFLYAIPLFFGYVVAFCTLFFLFAIIASLAIKKVDPPSPDRRPQNPFYRFLLIEAYSIALRFMRVRVTVSGTEHLPKPGKTFLLVSNHLSNYDHMTMMVRLRRHKLAFISKPENYAIPVIGRYLQESAFLPIDRENAMNADTHHPQRISCNGGGGTVLRYFPGGDEKPHRGAASLPRRRVLCREAGEGSGRCCTYVWLPGRTPPGTVESDAGTYGHSRHL